MEFQQPFFEIFSNLGVDCFEGFIEKKDIGFRVRERNKDEKRLEIRAERKKVAVLLKNFMKGEDSGFDLIRNGGQGRSL